MTRYQELQAKFEELQKDIRAIDSKDTYQPFFLLQEASNLIRELLKELDTPRLLKSDREGMQDWDGGEKEYQAYRQEFGCDEDEEEEEPLLGYYDADLNMFGLSKEE